MDFNVGGNFFYDKIAGAGVTFSRARRSPSPPSMSSLLRRVVLNMASARQDFTQQVAPENYVAGLGRGATGFTTRSDLGPAREGPTPEQIQAALAKRAQLLGAAAPTAYGATTREKGGKEEDKEEEDERFQDPDNEVGLFAYGQFDQEDDEADRIYQEVDEKMDKRRRARSRPVE
ncbi:unnamed protein product [Penicillium palitans]